MALSAQVKGLLVNGLKGLAAVGLAFGAKYLASPAVLNFVGSGNQWIVLTIVIPALLGLEKYVGVKSAAKKAANKPQA